MGSTDYNTTRMNLSREQLMPLHGTKCCQGVTLPERLHPDASANKNIYRDLASPGNVDAEHV
jgi:hypothetical protein